VLENNQKIKTVGILQPGYLPWLGFFEQLYRSDIFVIYDDVQFEKGSWRNRNRIKTPQGAVWLTVPVLSKGRDFPLIKDIEINNAVPWQKKHIRTIAQNYSKASFFNEYIDGLESILARPCRYLIDLNMKLIVWMAEQLEISTPIKMSSELDVPGKSIQRLIAIIQTLDGNHFYEGSAGRNYIDGTDFKKAAIALTFQDYQHPEHPQLHGEFISHLSAIDYLFNCGNNRPIFPGRQ
jgi:hypothetical protein